VNTEVVMTVES